MRSFLLLALAALVFVPLHAATLATHMAGPAHAAIPDIVVHSGVPCSSAASITAAQIFPLLIRRK